MPNEYPKQIPALSVSLLYRLHFTFLLGRDVGGITAFVRFLAHLSRKFTGELVV